MIFVVVVVIVVVVDVVVVVVVVVVVRGQPGGSTSLLKVLLGYEFFLDYLIFHFSIKRLVNDLKLLSKKIDM